MTDLWHDEAVAHRRLLWDLIELHRPYVLRPGTTDPLDHLDPSDLWCESCRSRYPCPTVQFIKDRVNPDQGATT